MRDGFPGMMEVSVPDLKMKRRERDSNPRSASWRTTDFESAAFDRSAISPVFRSYISHFTFHIYISHFTFTFLRGSPLRNGFANCGMILRRKRDSNPRSRGVGTTVFKTAAFDRSAISPFGGANVQSFSLHRPFQSAELTIN
jgi:hypothetical protein